MRRNKSLKNISATYWWFVVVFIIIYSVAIQVENYISLKNYNLKLCWCSKFQIIEPSLQSTKVHCGKFYHIPNYLVYVCMQIAYIKTYTRKISWSYLNFQKHFYSCSPWWSLFFLMYVYYAATLKISIQFLKWRFMMKIGIEVLTFWAKLLYHCCL